MTIKSLLITSLICTHLSLHADSNTDFAGSGKLNLTGLIPNIDGVAGAGISHSAIIGGYGTEDQIGAAGNFSQVQLSDFKLSTQSVLVGFYNRIELSHSKSEFDTQDVGAQLGLGEGYTFKNQTTSLKLRLMGDAILDQDSWLPQIAIGYSEKSSDNAAVLNLIGSQSDDDSEVFVSASKLFLSQSLLLNLNLRNTRANQNGILGFGGDKESKKEWLFEGSLAYLLNDNLALGYEYKASPDNLSFAKQEDWQDLFLLYNPSKHVSLTLAYVSLGEIALQPDQTGYYASISIQF